MRPTSALVLALLAVLGRGDALRAQSAEDLAAQCAAAGGNATHCARGAGAGRDLAGYVAVLAGPGSAVPGQASTLGMRIGGAPRFAVSLRGAGVSVVVPDLLDTNGSRESSFFGSAAELTLALGVFEGLSVLPTVGGLFSVDIFGSASLPFYLPSEEVDRSVSVLSVGARLGLLRESFTLPAVTLSVARRFSGEVILEPLDLVGADPGITSLRATVGKDLFAFGVLAGVGWDDISSATTLRATNGAVVTADVEASRRTYFLGLSRQLSVLSWISAEVGWMEAFEPVAGGAGASPDPGRQVFGGVSFVLRL